MAVVGSAIGFVRLLHSEIGTVADCPMVHSDFEFVVAFDVLGELQENFQI